MRICVTGSTGFVGRQLVPHLRRAGHEVVLALRRAGTGGAPLRKGIRPVVVGEIQHFNGWDEVLQGTDAVIHLAARAHVTTDRSKDPLAEFRTVNVRGTVTLARSAGEAGVKRFIQMSSIGVLGNRTAAAPFSDRDSPAPVEAYAVSKAEAEGALEIVAADAGMEVIILRPPLICGPGAPGNLRRLTAVVAQGVPIPVPARPNRRSFLGISNLVDALLCCLKASDVNGERLALADDDVLSTEEVLRALARGMGRRVRTIRLHNALLEGGATMIGKRDVYDKVFGSLEVDAARAKAVLDWSPVCPTASSLEAAGRAFVENALGDHGAATDFTAAGRS